SGPFALWASLAPGGRPAASFYLSLPTTVEPLITMFSTGNAANTGDIVSPTSSGFVSAKGRRRNQGFILTIARTGQDDAEGTLIGWSDAAGSERVQWSVAIHQCRKGLDLVSPYNCH